MSKKNIFKVVLVLFLLVVLIFTTKVDAARFNMSYLYGDFEYSTLVARTNNSLNEVSPSYFDLYASGNLKLNTVDSNFVREMHSKGIKVVPFLSNHWDKAKGRSALANIPKLTTQIADAIEKYDLDGVNVDIENVTEKDKENYTLLVKTLREKLGPNKTIAVAVAANPYNWQTGWHGSYDYTNLAKYADYLMLMTYDEHYEGGGAGPVASIDFVEKSIQYALERVDASKVVLGIPFFGRYWQDGVDYGGYGISLTKVKELTSKYKTSFYYDKSAQAVKARMTVELIENKPVVNGKILKTGTYTIWYENKQSISAKLDLVNKYNLKGTGSWSLGQETQDTWKYYKTKLNEGVAEEETNLPVENDMTNSASEWALEAIGYAKGKGWMNGRTDGNFNPKEKLTRAEFATIITRILNLEQYSAKEYNYTDTIGHWAEKYINLVTASGYMNGYEDGSFKPEKNITREEVAKVLANMKLKDEINIQVSNVSFNDIDASTWSYNSVMKIAQYGVIKGYEDGTFKPKKAISREEMAVILMRAF